MLRTSVTDLHPSSSQVITKTLYVARESTSRSTFKEMPAAMGRSIYLDVVESKEADADLFKAYWKENCSDIMRGPGIWVKKGEKKKKKKLKGIWKAAEWPEPLFTVHFKGGVDAVWYLTRDARRKVFFVRRVPQDDSSEDMILNKKMKCQGGYPYVNFLEYWHATPVASAN
ncbi:hypothetical protein NOR_00813 [Metarhizium rileyi]|uniref:Uncharacterized protein n=1 Tax=Metarhizium rileyi (strain RCEF 4871) TaxID=1649241 RepID=A0A167JJF5_METRR|nr:hypothetical protein NOR_00813 [Metarhizium rileyi RCEF 4871]